MDKNILITPSKQKDEKQNIDFYVAECPYCKSKCSWYSKMEDVKNNQNCWCKHLISATPYKFEFDQFKMSENKQKDKKKKEKKQKIYDKLKEMKKKLENLKENFKNSKQPISETLPMTADSLQNAYLSDGTLKTLIQNYYLSPYNKKITPEQVQESLSSIVKYLAAFPQTYLVARQQNNTDMVNKFDTINSTQQKGFVDILNNNPHLLNVHKQIYDYLKQFNPKMTSEQYNQNMFALFKYAMKMFYNSVRMDKVLENKQYYKPKVTALIIDDNSSDGETTVATIDMNQYNTNDPEDLVGMHIHAQLHDENGMPIEITGNVVEILDVTNLY